MIPLMKYALLRGSTSGLPTGLTVPFDGVFLYLSADSTANWSGGVAIPWDTELYDTRGFHAGSNTTIVIPSSVNGKYGVFTGQVAFATGLSTTASCGAYITRDSNIIAANGTEDGPETGWGGIHYVNIHTNPFLLTTGESYELYVSTTDISADLDASYCCFSLEVTQWP